MFTRLFLFPYFKQYHILIATDLYKQEEIDCKQQVLIQKQYSKLILLGIYVKKKQIFIIIEEVKATILDFSQGTGGKL